MARGWGGKHVLSVTVRVVAESDDEARAAAWRQWYQRAPQSKIERLIHDACAVDDAGEPAQENAGPKA